MIRYENKTELINEIETNFELFCNEFIEIPEKDFNNRILEDDKTPYEMLAYQVGWLDLILSWEEREKNGETVKTPTDDLGWNELGKLYEQFYKKYEGKTKAEMLEIFKQSKDRFVAWIETLNNTELYASSIRQWSVTKANWPVIKWIHINSVAPFKSFRSKIRKWKREKSKKRREAKAKEKANEKAKEKAAKK